MLVKIPVSIGELYDKISILQIKLARIGKEKNKEYSLQENYLQKKLQKWMRIFLKD